MYELKLDPTTGLRRAHRRTTIACVVPNKKVLVICLSS